MLLLRDAFGRSLFLTLLMLCTRAALGSDCPPESADFDADGVADQFRLGPQASSASIVSGADQHLIATLRTEREQDHFSGIFEPLSRNGRGLAALAGLVAEGDHPFGSVVLQ